MEFENLQESHLIGDQIYILLNSLIFLLDKGLKISFLIKTHFLFGGWMGKF